MDTTLITGNTFPVRDQLKALGGRWDAAAKGWRVPVARAAEARKLVAPSANSNSPAPRPARRWWPCGYPGCHPGICDDCDGRGGRFRPEEY